MTRFGWIMGLFLVAVGTGGCGDGSTKGDVLIVDAEFDPATSANTSRPIHEANLGVAQTFTVLADGKLEEFWIVVTDGESVDDGTIRITIRPVDGMGLPNRDPASSIIVPIDVDTSTLPATLVETFTEFSVGDDPGREVLVGEVYAIVVDFVSRATSTDVNAIARVSGQTNSGGDPYVDGTGSTGTSGAMAVGFTNNTDDYFFRTFSLQ